MNKPAKLSDLMLSLEMPSEDFCHYFDRKTGAVVTVEDALLSSLEDGAEEDSGDFEGWDREEYEAAKEIFGDDGSRFVSLPDKFDFDEYHVMEKFIRSLDDHEAASQLWNAIKGSGAFRYFKDTLHRLGIQQSWYDYLDAAQRKFVIEWARENDVPYKDDLRKPRK